MNEPHTDAAPESPPLPTADEPDELFCVDCELSGVLLDNVKVSGDSELTRGRISIHVRAKTLAGAVVSASQLRPEDLLRITLRPLAAWQVGEQPVATNTEQRVSAAMSGVQATGDSRRNDVDP